VSKLKELREELGIPRRTDFKESKVSLGLKVSTELAKRALKQADKEQISMATLITKALTKYLEGGDK